MSYCFQHIYSKDDCTFREQILPDGYNIYISVRHGALLSLGSRRQRLQGRDRGVPALAQFLPRISTLDHALYYGLDVPDQPGQNSVQTEKPVDSVESFGTLSQIIHSPSFHKRWDSSSEISVTGYVLGCSVSEARSLALLPNGWKTRDWLHSQSACTRSATSFQPCSFRQSCSESSAWRSIMFHPDIINNLYIYWTTPGVCSFIHPTPSKKPMYTRRDVFVHLEWREGDSTRKHR